MSNAIDAEKAPAADAQPRETEAKKKPAKDGKRATKAKRAKKVKAEIAKRFLRLIGLRLLSWAGEPNTMTPKAQLAGWSLFHVPDETSRDLSNEPLFTLNTSMPA